MKKKRGSSVQLTLPDVELVIERLKRMPGVTKVVSGSISQAPHMHKAGELKWIDRKGKVATLRAYSARGMQTLQVHADDLAKLQESLVAIPSRYSPRAKTASVLPPESKIERRAREQPIYPADPSPMKSADPVKDSELVGRLVSVTPEIAINWLERNSHNRPLRNADVMRYATDMRMKRWMPGGVVIKFASDGTIINGQHTLWAVIESGCTIEVYVLTGVDPNVVMVEDDHARRRLTDVIRLTHPGSIVGNNHVAVATMLRYSMGWHNGDMAGGHPLTRQQEMSFIDEHYPCIDFAYKAVSNNRHRRGICVSPVMAPIARAWHTEDREKLMRFGAVLSSGIVDDTGENTAVLLRNYLLGGNALSGTMTQKQDTYRRAERALRAFLNRERLQILKPAQEEQFLLPGERPRVKRKIA